MSIRKNRCLIYVGEDVRKLLTTTKAPLSSVINLMAERYLGVIERADRAPMFSFHAELFCNVLREIGHPLTSREIAAFPASCEDWLRRNPNFPKEPARTAILMTKSAEFHELLALVCDMEKDVEQKKGCW